ncbi:glycoside hydrolase family 97 catalytic domain-containing protein [Mucilaginibacter sabulilitoris]|uniref:Glycoside hydrolase family 97 catalytic domain-containing protein n=1 Tax=Mucilaginibacter sabulilitoris TaxID=1173583 RepID=A0ABZ0TI29_9SPHI|nr:glycoside hydrolase family 97 catalytic domain-containing protein [Mucilaginibacter sabulilitoris]WPU92846.1 glycoside hydrolase family 97 catalytic domain-containing protein [Mucilaginibacter sabulilitoris]
MKNRFIYCALSLTALNVFFLTANCLAQTKALDVQSEDHLNKITLFLSGEGRLSYNVTRRNKIIIASSPLGLSCNDQDFTSGLSVVAISPVQKKREQYELKVANNKSVDHVFESRSITLKNELGALIIMDLVAGKEGVAFRYRFHDGAKQVRSIKDELTGFHIAPNSKGWMEPYNKAGKYTPGYEDFYLNVNSGDSIFNPRNPSVGWCMPALFNVNNNKNWVLIAESGTDGSYPGCHLQPDAKGGIYRIAFAEKDEKYTLPLADKEHAYPESSLPWTMPWRTIVIGDQAGDILLSTLITDLAPASKIEDISWIEPGKAAWSWWSHPDDHSPEIYNEFTDLSASLGFKYTLFDAGWEKANREGKIIDHAIAKGVKPLVWGYSSEYFDPKKRKARFKQLAEMGVKGVKIDFWCSDRQEVMAALQSVFEDAAKEHLLIDLHGTTVPRGWQRTWPNYVTAEASLRTESYFYEPRFPEKAAEQNTVVPFTRNVAGPVDYTPFALTIRKYPRLNTAVHELATAMTYTSGIIHFADSKEVFDSLPVDVKNLFKEMPSTWDRTECIIAEPGKSLVLSRQKDALHYIVGINGTNNKLPVKLDLQKWGDGFSKFRLISEGKDRLMEFKVQTYPIKSDWSYVLVPKGGFIIQFIK